MNGATTNDFYIVCNVFQFFEFDDCQNLDRFWENICSNMELTRQIAILVSSLYSSMLFN